MEHQPNTEDDAQYKIMLPVLSTQTSYYPASDLLDFFDNGLAIFDPIEMTICNCLLRRFKMFPVGLDFR